MAEYHGGMDERRKMMWTMLCIGAVVLTGWVVIGSGILARLLDP
ncbi:hypothetical protein [Paeniglutamicibacter sp.]